MSYAPVLEVENLVRHYSLPRQKLLHSPGIVQAVNGVSFSIQPGRSFGIVGESGCGKSTLARMVMGLEHPDKGSVRLLGQALGEQSGDALRRLRRHFQMVFQDPYGSLDPRQKVGRIVAEPLDALAPLGQTERAARIVETLASVGLRATDADKYPHEFSGGQRQRIAIARALITRPALIVADEPVSALDVSVQAQVLNLLQDLQRDANITFLLISHDLAVVDYVCDDIAVMYLGQFVEQAETGVLLGRPAHPYTRALLAAVPGGGRTDLASAPLPAPLVAAAAGSTGCAYAPRCPFAQARCRQEAPLLRDLGGHKAACHFAESIIDLPLAAAGFDH